MEDLTCGGGIIINPGSPDDKNSIPLATRSGEFIPNVREREFLPQRLQAAAELWQESLPNAHLRSLTAVYNCMGMVFGCRRTFIDVKYLERILKEDNYRKLDSIRAAEIGDVAVYKNDGEAVHVGIVIEIERNLENATRTLVILSQWGQDGEWIHPQDCVPALFGQISEVWTDRRTI
jgi:hypothetical protein